MFYDLTLRIAFIHVPRTGGVAVTQAFKPYIGIAGGFDLGRLRHLPHDRMKQMLGPEAETVRWFAIDRPFDEIRASLGRLIERDRSAIQNGARLPREWTDVLFAEDPMEAAFAIPGWPRNKADWRRFWLGSEPRGIRLLRFSSLADDLATLCRDWCLPDIRLPEGVVN